MNQFYETWHNREHFKGNYRRGFTVFEVDTKNVSFRVGSDRKPWSGLSAFHRRKLENLFVIENSNERLKFLYL